MSTKWDRYYNRKRYQYTDIDGFKKECGEIPEATCPDIDKIIEMLEELRTDNGKLRDLGKAWYEKCGELVEVLDEAYDHIEEIEDKLNDEIDKSEKLQTELDNLA